MISMVAVKPSPAPQARRCWVEGRRVCLELRDGSTAGFPADRFPRLSQASPEQLGEVTLRVDGRALRWETLDEDIWIEDALLGKFPNLRS
jgi:hypothetical protein